MLSDKRDIQQLREDQLRTDVVMPLLKAMGYRDVDHWHGGPGELGKDVVGWKEKDLGRENLAVVAKAGNISGATTSAGIVATQLNQAFGAPFRNKVTQEEHPVHICWVVSNGTIAKQARDAICSTLPEYRRPYVRFIDLDTLWNLVEKYLGVKLYRGLNETQQVLREFDSSYSTEVQFLGSGAPVAIMESEGRRVVIGEKFQGASDKNPLQGQIGIRTDSPEGRDALAAFERALRTGETAKIPGEYLEIKFPEIIERASEQLLGVKRGITGTLYVFSATDPTRRLVRIDVECDDGDKASLDYVDLAVVRRGTEEVVLQNHKQPIPIKVTVTENFKEKLATLAVGTDSERMTANWAVSLAELGMCMGKPSITRIVSLDDGVILREFRRDTGTENAPSHREVAVIRDLATIESKIGQRIPLPQRRITEEEQATINHLRALLRTNQLRGTWEHLTLPCPRDTAKHVLEAWQGRQVAVLRLDAEAEATLFDTHLSLGVVRSIYEEAVLENEQEVRERLSEKTDSTESIAVRFIPGSKNTMVQQYLNWGAGQGTQSQGNANDADKAPS